VQTLVRGATTRGEYRRLAIGPGEPYLPRLDLLRRAPDAGRARARRSLLYLAHLSDLHLLDAQAPCRLEPMIALSESTWAGAFRPQEQLTVHTVAAMVEGLRRASLSPLSGAPMAAAVVTGDSTDMLSELELRWYIELLDGGTVDPGSSAGAYHGVQAWAEADWAYRPGARGGRDSYAEYGFPVLPELLGQAVAGTVTSPGLPAPWYSVFGNHDVLLFGAFGATERMRELAVGGRKSFSMPATVSMLLGDYAAESSAAGLAGGAARDAFGTAGTRRVPANPGRRLFDQRGFMAEHFRTASRPGPVGHGFTEHNLRTGETWWRAELSSAVRLLGLDTCNAVAGPDGAVTEAQFRWLERELRLAQSERRLVLVASHHNSRTLDNPARRPGQQGRLHWSEELVGLLLRFPAVVAWLNGHTHVNQILAHADPGGGFWELTTASCIDFPQQQQTVEILDNRDGTLSLFTTIVDHASPTVPSGDGTSADLAAQSRELALNDWIEQPLMRRGSPLDRNTELLLPAPFPLDAINDAALEAERMTHLARIAAHRAGALR
jgi:metallophosphoesterase (TIGR03767 family)